MTDFKAKMRTEVRLAILDVLEKESPLQSCINCEHFELQPTTLEKCKLFNARPPARIIVYGCEKWMEKDEISF